MHIVTLMMEFALAYTMSNAFNHSYAVSLTSYNTAVFTFFITLALFVITHWFKFALNLEGDNKATPVWASQ